MFPLFSNLFQKVDGPRRKYAIVISNLRLYQTITDISFVRSLIIMIQYYTWAIWWIKDFENFGQKCKFHNFSILAENGRGLKIDFIGHLNVLLFDINWTEYIIHHLNLQLVQKYHIFETLC